MSDLEAKLRHHNAALLEPRVGVQQAAARDVAFLAYLLEKYGAEGIAGLLTKATELNKQVYKELARAEGLL